MSSHQRYEMNSRFGDVTGRYWLFSGTSTGAVFCCVDLTLELAVPFHSFAVVTTVIDRTVVYLLWDWLSGVLLLLLLLLLLFCECQKDKTKQKVSKDSACLIILVNTYAILIYLSLVKQIHFTLVRFFFSFFVVVLVGLLLLFICFLFVAFVLLCCCCCS